MTGNYSDSCADSDPDKKRGTTWGSEKTQKKKFGKFDFVKMKEAATHESRAVRKCAFIEYFERFGEFPSFLFDNEQAIDERFRTTIKDLELDKETAKVVLHGIVALRIRLSF